MRGAVLERRDRDTCYDIDDVAASLRRTGGDMHQLGNGALNCEHSHVQLGDACINRVAVNRVVHAFNSWASNDGYVLIVSANESARFCGHRLSAGQICINHSGDAWDVVISGEWLRIEFLDDSTSEHVESLARSTEHYADAPRILRPNRHAFTQVLHQASRLLASQDTRADEPSEPDQDLVESLKQALLMAGGHRPESPRSTRNHRRVVLNSRQFMVDHIAKPLTVNDVCSAVDVSERTLRYAFHEAFDLSPMAYFKLMRLNAVHSEFKAHDRSTVTVHEVAERYGFEHLGAFASDYRKLFGVYPSETLAPVRRSPAGG